ncbi:exonuclease domain-containing protein [Poritiphilus flavus]|uniref:GIY-YIG nuclease family protein n=1 Tax=Poritiphilus flavus TaxID=2697053 RepID=A0A6L9EF82_9FLAO|nr:exonuclease domain-containing protein [Poritiphilus flavus]NAS13397.1 GIY-YIG nuclease family protein [Poritiphilus flavus]
MYAVLDIETTGGKYDEEGITEIAIHRFDGHHVVDKFVSLVNPEREIQPFVVNLTGINKKMLRSAPKFHEVAKRIVEITQDAVLVAHNAQFDYRILRTEFRRLGYNYERKTICTVSLSQKLIPEAESHSLGKLVRSLGIAVSDRHRADGDAIATLKLFKVLLSKDIQKSIIREVVRDETLGELSARQLDIVESTPSETGVYYMHNKDGDIIFLGKSRNMKKRVNQHFIKSGDRARQLQKDTKKVTYELTGSELVALLKENEELLRNRPKYNFVPGTSLNDHQHVDKSADQRLPEEDLLIVDRGRTEGERSAILVKEGHFKGLGFFDLNHQINNIHILESIITPMEGNSIATDIIVNYLEKRTVLKIIPLSKKD